jgi:hypothetical protein
MAYWQRRDGKVRVLGYDLQSKKKKVLLSRAESQHLDILLDHEADDWVRRWANLRGLAANVPRLSPVRETDILAHVERFLAYLLDHEGKHPNTIAEYRRCIVKHALPFFVHEPGCKALADFPDHSKDLAIWLALSPKLTKRVSLSLGKFWRWAVEEGACAVTIGKEKSLEQTLSLTAPISKRPLTAPYLSRTDVSPFTLPGCAEPFYPALQAALIP